MADTPITVYPVKNGEAHMFLSPIEDKSGSMNDFFGLMQQPEPFSQLVQAEIRLRKENLVKVPATTKTTVTYHLREEQK